MSNKDDHKEDTGSEGPRSSPCLPDSNMNCEPAVDNSEGPSQPTSKENSSQEKENSSGDQRLDSCIIEISDEESNASSGPSRALMNAAPPVEKKRRIGGEMTVYKVRFNFVGENPLGNDQNRNRIVSNDDPARAGQSTSSSSRQLSNAMVREPLVDNSEGPSQSTTKDKSSPDKDNAGQDQRSDSCIIEISDEESNASSGPSRASGNAAPPAEKKRKIGGEMTVYKVKFNFVGENSMVNEQPRTRTNNSEENREEAGRAGQSTTPARLPDPNAICESLIPKLMDQSDKTQCRVIRKPLQNTVNPGQNQQRSDSAIIEISDEESNASSGPSSRAPINAPRPVERKRKTGGEMTMYSYKLKLNLVRENALLFTDQNTYRIRNTNEEQEEETEEAGQGPSPHHLPDQNVISESVITKLIDSCEGLTQSKIKSKPQPENSQGPQPDANIIEISDDESNTSSGPSAVTQPNASQAIENGNSLYEKTFKQEKEDCGRDEGDQA
ncbi:uncharacterized protein LOC124542859 [Vanessa cardui]|uniref:uncharacterized protein LOC124542859 n=1 Tax=Vanessa cardui TaxID=171605 RepID=UPI001F1337A4|nr:uncharacterized protein LOC124542859 [Vanessa cardui]XP_046976702.1 uncharacterized protein LOC124542859 [Vanessa cardui]